MAQQCSIVCHLPELLSYRGIRESGEMYFMCTTSTLEVLWPVRLPLASQLLTVVTYYCHLVLSTSRNGANFVFSFGENALRFFLKKLRCKIYYSLGFK
jgi:hypothetical protein